MTRDLLDKAQADLKMAEFGTSTNDDSVITLAAYHVQQAIEKILRFCLNELGIKYPKTHEIDILLELFPKTQELVSNELLNQLEEKSDQLTNWESKTRYQEGYKVKLKFVILGYNLAASLYDNVNTNFIYLQNESRKVIKEPIDSTIRDDARTPDWLKKEENSINKLKQMLDET